MSSSAAFAVLLRRPWELRSESSNPQQKPPAPNSHLPASCAWERRQTCAWSLSWPPVGVSHPNNTKPLTEDEQKQLADRLLVGQYHTPTAAGSVLEPTEERQQTTRWIRSMEEFGWGLLPYRCYFLSPQSGSWLTSLGCGLEASCATRAWITNPTLTSQRCTLCAALGAMKRSGIQTASWAQHRDTMICDKTVISKQDRLNFLCWSNQRHYNI